MPSAQTRTKTPAGEGSIPGVPGLGKNAIYELNPSRSPSFQIEPDGLIPAGLMNQPSPSWLLPNLILVEGCCTTGSSGVSAAYWLIPMLNSSHCSISFGEATIPPAPK